MKITDLKCAVIGGQPTIRIATDAGLSGYGQIEWFKPYIKPHVLFLKDKLIIPVSKDFLLEWFSLTKFIFIILPKMAV